MNPGLIIYILERELPLFLLIFLRTLFLLVIFPIFAGNFFPTKGKIALSLVLALSLTPFLSSKVGAPKDLGELFFLIISDFFLMFVVALFFRLIIGGLQLGGELVGLQMGFGISQTFDPISGVSMPVIAQFIYFIFIFFFFSLDVHHNLIYFLIKSFYELPPGILFNSENFFRFIIKKSHLLFDIAVKFLAPLIVFMFLINVILGVIGRLLPQINVLFVSFPLTLGLGLFFLSLMLLVVPKVLKQYFFQFGEFLISILRL
ncbi:MAG: flagellar biosynthetic protein FliR [Caldimicrobium sp.]|nr:flagellar biosynthetic protein FliR [Caldimicrobium sp.]MCX7874100.1 flagellar biosynthetic protein FliR [Caldimicrobium sp.]MDW8093765.1 flagellar biosynthetic protein FliR [Caldimicrobium sp.]